MATNNANDFNNPIAITQGGTNASSMATAYGVVYYDGTSLVTTDAGSSGQILTSNGSGMAPNWQTAGGGGGAPSGQGWDLIQSQTFPVGAFVLNFTTGITNAYNNYVVVFSKGAGPETDIRYSTDGGVSYFTTGYTAGISRVDLRTGAGPGLVFTDNADAPINASQSSGATPGYGSIVYLFNVTNGQPTTLVGLGCNNRMFGMARASLGNSSAINALQFYKGGFSSSSGNIVSLYGIKE